MLDLIKDFESIKKACEKTDFVIINDHGGKVKLAGIGTLHNGKTVAMFNENRYYSTNEMYVDEKGIPHVSRWSAGPTIVGGNANIQKINDELFFENDGIQSVLWSDGSVTNYTLSIGYEKRNAAATM